MELKTFSEKYRLKANGNGCGEVTIKGRWGQIYEYGSGKLGVMFMPPPTKEKPWGIECLRKWNGLRCKATAAGMELVQNGDSEGCLTFDPADKAQALLAIKIAGCRPKKQLSAVQVAKMIATLAEFRSNPKVEGQYNA